LVNLLPELGSDTITTVLPLPQDEALWDSLHLLFATASGACDAIGCRISATCGPWA